MPQPEQDSQNGNISETRDSELRKQSAPYVQRFVNALHAACPKLTPNEVTWMGTIGVGVGSAASAMRNPESENFSKLTALSLGINTGFTLTDMIDGTLQRTIEAENPEKTNPNGPWIDPVSDRLQELFLSLSRSVSAHKRCDTFGQFAALATAVTSPGPSIAKTYAEKNNRLVPEIGKGIFGKVGNRVGRAVLGILATAFPKIHGIPVQPIADIFMTSANIVTTAQRIEAAKHPSDKEISQKTLDAAKKRQLPLIATGVVSIAASAGLLYALHREKQK